MTKRIILFFIIFICFILLGCERYDVVKPGDPKYPIIKPFPYEYSSEIILYYPDNQLTQLFEEKREIKHKNGKKEEILIKELLKGTNSTKLRNIISNQTKLISINVQRQIAYVNFSEDITNKGMNEKEEAFVLYSIVNTLTQLKEISRVQILIEGEKKNVLINHFDISKSVGRSDFITEKGYSSPTDTLLEYYESLKNGDYFKAINLQYDYKNKDNKDLLISELKYIYRDIQDYQIKDYFIDKYDKNIIVKADFELLFLNGNKNKENLIFFIKYEDDNFIIDKIIKP